MERVPRSHHTACLGVLAVGTKVHNELRWEFRVQGGDFGIDAQIEVIANGKPTGSTIAVQIKSGASYFANEDEDGIVFRSDREHLDYWLNHSLPVIVVLYDPASDAAHWQHVPKENVTLLRKGWKVSIPRGQKLEGAQSSRLEQIASSGARRVEQLQAELGEYRCPFCGAPLVERGGDWVGTEHYGLHEVFECGHHALDGCGDHPCPSDPPFPRFEDYELEFHPCSAEPETSWLCVAIPKTSMARKVRLGGETGRSKVEAERRIREAYGRASIQWKPRA